MKRNYAISWLFCSFVFLFTFIYACKDKDVTVDVGAAPINTPYPLGIDGFPIPNIPPDNQLTANGVRLGRMLFYEKKLSKDNTLSCASCHNQATAFSDTARFSLGIGNAVGHRQAMPVFNMLWHTNAFFWDGRAELLREQALHPIQDRSEMNETLENVIAKLQSTSLYPIHFKNAFGSPDITPENIGKALEQFMNTIVSTHSKYDDYLAGHTTLTPQEERGRFLFFTEYNPAFPEASGADCQHCHGGANFENDAYMNNGLDTDATLTDKGRETVTGNSSDRGKFKVPSLRNVALTPPYMHDGRFSTLEEVVEHYNLVKSSTHLDPAFLQQLPAGLQLSTDDKAALVAFLKTLTDNSLATDPRYSSPF